MKQNLLALKKLFFLYFFSFLPFGLLTEVLDFTNIIRVKIVQFPLLQLSGFSGIIMYTVAFSLSLAVINWLTTNFAGIYHRLKTYSRENMEVANKNFVPNMRIEKSLSKDSIQNIEPDFTSGIAI